MMDNSTRACYKPIGRMTIERAYEDILSDDENEYWSAALQSDSSEIIETTWKSYAMSRNSIQLPHIKVTKPYFLCETRVKERILSKPCRTSKKKQRARSKHMKF
jgi:hypothetical protein